MISKASAKADVVHAVTAVLHSALGLLGIEWIIWAHVCCVPCVCRSIYQYQ